MDLERLPSGKFATNSLILLLGMLAYNALRLCGQTALREDRDQPPQHRIMAKKGKRRPGLRYGDAPMPVTVLGNPINMIDGTNNNTVKYVTNPASTANTCPICRVKAVAHTR